ncbi:hypothetical protein TNCV_1419511 [Trichonephila clavipes]|nr:hypothetical protein TNCV_1419511 [Trichonephila clavipes]
MTTKPHPKTVRTQTTIKKVKSLNFNRKLANSKIRCIETKNVFRHMARHAMMGFGLLKKPFPGQHSSW